MYCPTSADWPTRLLATAKVPNPAFKQMQLSKHYIVQPRTTWPIKAALNWQWTRYLSHGIDDRSRLPLPQDMKLPPYCLPWQLPSCLSTTVGYLCSSFQDKTTTNRSRSQPISYSTDQLQQPTRTANLPWSKLTNDPDWTPTAKINVPKTQTQNSNPNPQRQWTTQPPSSSSPSAPPSTSTPRPATTPSSNSLPSVPPSTSASARTLPTATNSANRFKKRSTWSSTWRPCRTRAGGGISCWTGWNFPRLAAGMCRFMRC